MSTSKSDRSGMYIEPAPQWRSLSTSYEDLVCEAESWRQTKSTPEVCRSMLDVTRRLFVHTYFVYEASGPILTWALIAVEAALRQKYGAGNKPTLSKLIKIATSDGTLDPDAVDALDAGRQLRNRLVHGHSAPILPPGLLAINLNVSHAIVADLFPD